MINSAMNKFVPTWLTGFFLLTIPTYGLTDIKSASRPLEEGVPQVAVTRFQSLLATDISSEERLLATAKLGEAMVAAGEPEKALQLLQDPNLRAVPAAHFWHAQAEASLGHWPEALSLYQQVAKEETSTSRNAALLGQAEALRALGHPEEALQILA